MPQGAAYYAPRYMQQGAVFRTTEATNCNAVSSRSHAVLQASA